MAAAQDGYRVLIADSSEVASEESILAGEARRRCDGLVLCAPRMSEADLEELVPTLHPVVLINRTTEDNDTPSLLVDYGQGIQDLAELLLTQGHRRLAFLAGPDRSASNVLRLRGLEDLRRRRPGLELQVIPGGSNFESGHSSVPAVLRSGATGILAFNDLVGMGLLSGLHESGVRVPEEISVTGFDDIPFARYTTPSLTTAAVPITELGEAAWHRMRDLLHGVPSRIPQWCMRPGLWNAAAPVRPPAPDATLPDGTLNFSHCPHAQPTRSVRRPIPAPAGVPHRDIPGCSPAAEVPTQLLSGQPAPWPSRATSSRILAVGDADSSCPITSGLSHTWLRSRSRKTVAASLVSKSRSTATLSWSPVSRNTRTDRAPEAARPAGSLSKTVFHAS